MKNQEIVQKCKKCKTIFKITIIESSIKEPLSYVLQCPACCAHGIYEIETAEY